MRRFVVLALAVAAPSFFSGCGGAVETTTVEGKISFNGTPVTGGIINFLPANGRPLGGPINSDGTYSSSLPPGEYQVRIDAPAPLPPGFKEGDPLSQLGPRPVPEKYANFNSSGLTATVEPGGKQTLDFALP